MTASSAYKQARVNNGAMQIFATMRVLDALYSRHPVAIVQRHVHWIIRIINK